MQGCVFTGYMDCRSEVGFVLAYFGVLEASCSIFLFPVRAVDRSRPCGSERMASTKRKSPASHVVLESTQSWTKALPTRRHSLIAVTEPRPGWTLELVEVEQ